MTLRKTTRCEDCKSKRNALTEFGEGEIVHRGLEGDAYRSIVHTVVVGQSSSTSSSEALWKGGRDSGPDSSTLV